MSDKENIFGIPGREFKSNEDRLQNALRPSEAFHRGGGSSGQDGRNVDLQGNAPLTPEAQAALDKYVASLQGQGDAVIEIEGTPDAPVIKVPGGKSKYG